MKKSELLLVIVVLIFLGFIFIYFIYNVKNKQLQAIAIQKSKIQSEIQKLNANKTYIPKEVNNSNYENLLNFIRKYDLAKIEQVKSANNNVNINFILKGENFLKILDYIYKNEDFLKIDSFNVVNDNLNKLLVNLVILNLYKQPDVENISYYPFNLKFFNEKEYVDKIKKEIEERKKKEELEKLVFYSKEMSSKLYNNTESSTDNLNKSVNLNMVYKGAIFINNEKYGVLAINDKEYFLKEGQDLTIDKNNIRVLNINKQSVKLVINNSEMIEIKLNVF
jgi:hypothetical protein